MIIFQKLICIYGILKIQFTVLLYKILMIMMPDHLQRILNKYRTGTLPLILMKKDNELQ